MLLQLWYWRRLENSLYWEEIKPVNPKGNHFEYSLEGLMLKLQYFGHLMRRADSLENSLMLGKIEGRRRRGDREWDGWMASPTLWTWVWGNFRRWWMTGKTDVLQSMVSQIVGHYWVTEWQQKGWCHQGALFNMSANLEDHTVAIELQKVNPHPNSHSSKECVNHQTITLISHASKVMLKILHARL